MVSKPLQLPDDIETLKGIIASQSREFEVYEARINALKDGEELDQESFESINYYRDYPLKKRSFVRSILNEVLGTRILKSQR